MRLQKRKRGTLWSLPTSPAVFLLLPRANGCKQKLRGCLGRTWPLRAITSRKTTTGCSRVARLALAGLEHRDNAALKPPITFLISSLFQTVVVAYFFSQNWGREGAGMWVAGDMLGWQGTAALLLRLPAPGALAFGIARSSATHLGTVSHSPSILPNSGVFFFFLLLFLVMAMAGGPLSRQLHASSLRPLCAGQSPRRLSAGLLVIFGTCTMQRSVVSSFWDFLWSLMPRVSLQAYVCINLVENWSCELLAAEYVLLFSRMHQKKTPRDAGLSN